MKKLKFKYRFAVQILNLLSRTWRIKYLGNFPQSPSIIIFWHGFMLPAWFSFRNRNSYSIVSLSNDGEILSLLLKKWGFEVIRGSSSKNGKEVMELFTKNAKNGFTLITPDGPQGPIYKLKPGAIVSSIRTGTPLVLCSVKIQSKFIFSKSWDKFQLPYPFSRITIEFSESYKFDKNLSREEIDKIINNIENELNLLNDVIQN
jgi:lysophospholipid acyltransferase (LPLAT)-like uncharacterized protein